MNLRKKHSFLFGVLLTASVFLSTGCGALHMFEKSENERKFDAWKKEIEEDSTPDTLRQEQIRAELEVLGRDTPARPSDAQTGSRHGPPTEAEVEELRKKSTNSPRVRG